MATLYEFNNTAETHFYAYGIVWQGQTFLTSVAHTVTSVKLRVFRVGSPGTITVSIRATDGTLPTGADLASGTFNGNSVTTDTAGEEVEVTLSVAVSLAGATTYAIVIRAPSGNVSNFLYWKDSATNPYAGGQRVDSQNSGVAWSGFSDEDYWFEIWGDPLGSVIPPSKDTVVTITDPGGTPRILTPYIMNAQGLPGERSLVEVDTIGGVGRKFLAIWESPVITLDLHWSDDAGVGCDTVLGDLRDNGDVVAFEFGPAGDDAGQVKYSGNCWVRDYHVVSRVGSQVIARAELPVEGQVTRGTY